MKNLILLIAIFFSINMLQAQNVGIGTTTPAYKLDILSDTLSRALNVFLNSTEATGTVSALQAQALGHGTGSVRGGHFIANSTGSGDTYGLSTQVFTQGSGQSYGLWAHNQTSNIGGSHTGTRYGIYGLINGIDAGSMTGVFGHISGQSTIGRMATAIHGRVEAGATTGTSYAIRGVNENEDGYSAWLQGKVRIVSGEFASLSSGGYLQIGNSVEHNLVFDGNEIMARNNGSPSSMLLQLTGGNVLMCPLSSGQVSIGIFTDSGLPSSEYRLAVRGKGLFEEIRVDNYGDWPDYVFEEEYEMLPLEKLKDYVEENKHLPNIPSASEVKEEGLMLGDMQYRMMEKIEELTLYIIEQNERIVKLEEESSKVKK